jgi:hypothetical protein
VTDEALPQPKTFDIVQVLMGREFPTTEVMIYLNEKAGFELSKAQERRVELERREDDEARAELDRLDAEIAALTKQVKASRYVYFLKGIPAGERNELLDIAFAKYPKTVDPSNIFGGIQENTDRDELFGKLLLHAMTDKIVAPDGAVMIDLTVEQIEQFRKLAPDSALQAILQAQQDLTDGTKSGFELAAQDPDFS